jgi:hypothetical protein
VLAPSWHRSGVRYRWVRSLEDHEIAPAPDWLLDLIAASSKRKTAIVPEGEQLLVPIGLRHHALCQYLGLLRSYAWGEAALVAFADTFLDHCVEVDEARCPVDREHAHDTARWFARNCPPYRTNGGRR